MFEPWCGDEYKSGIEGRRVLILGESHYHNCDNDPPCREAETETDRELRHRNLTREVVEWWKDNPHPSPLSYRVPELFGIEKPKFWNKVVFYNYVQAFVGCAARVRPTEEMWADEGNAKEFQVVLDCFEPDRILVLGKKLWTNLPSSPALLEESPREERGLLVSNNVGSYNDVDRFCYWYVAHSGKSALAMPIMHPSAPRFELAKWKRPVADWLSFGK
jgi:hypothetical protein